jgi:SanA protein
MIVLCVVIDRKIENDYSHLIFNQIETLPHKSVGLLLGTGKYFRGKINPFYEGRIRAAAELYKQNKIDGILISGDNSKIDYDEPSSMKYDLVDLGVPAEHITLDYAGFRTLDSIVRAEKVFSLKNYTIISQKFHCQRALYLAKTLNHNSIAFAAKGPEGVYRFKVRLRDFFARFKAFLDIYILNTQPKFLGKKESIKLRRRD